MDSSPASEALNVIRRPAGDMRTWISGAKVVRRCGAARERKPGRLEASEQLVVVRVRADPEPDPSVVFANGESAVSERDADEVDRLRSMDLLEMESGMGRVFSEGAVGLASPDLNSGRQPLEALPEGGSGRRRHSLSGSSGWVLPEWCSESAASARAERRFRVVSRVLSHRCSSPLCPAGAGRGSARSCPRSVDLWCDSFLTSPSLFAWRGTSGVDVDTVHDRNGRG